jgi:hypothetical protein
MTLVIRGRLLRHSAEINGAEDCAIDRAGADPL